MSTPTRTPLQEAISFFDRVEQKTQEVPKGFFPASVYAKQKGIATISMKKRLDKQVALGTMTAVSGPYGPKNCVTTFYGPKEKP